MVLRNVGILPQHYIASQPIRPQLEFSQAFESDVASKPLKALHKFSSDM
jgi:hypothetical protein